MVLYNSQNQPIAYYSTNFENDDDLLRFLSKNNSSYHLAGTISPETPGTISSLCERADYGNARWVVRHRSTFGTTGIPVETDCAYYDDDMNEVMHGERTYDEKGILVASHFYEYKGGRSARIHSNKNRPRLLLRRLHPEQRPLFHTNALPE